MLKIENARHLWNPSLARVYGLRPWDMLDLLPSELLQIDDDIKELNKINGA